MNRKVCLSILIIGLFTVAAIAQTTTFNYQGNLKSGGVDASGNHDFEFALFDAASGGNQLGSTVTQSGVTVTNGAFAVSLDFGNQFPGANRFLEIRVRPTGGGAFTTLAPRQAISSVPYAVKSLNSDNSTTATNATQLGGVAANQYVVTGDPRLSDARPPTAGSSNYIQNQNAGPQASSNFNISGTGTADILNSATQYNVGGSRILGMPGTDNLFVGRNAGAANTTGQGNSFFGLNAGTLSNANFNSFFGTRAGDKNVSGCCNSFFGYEAGTNTNGVGGSQNSFFGAAAGRANTSGFGNTFIGDESGLSSTTGLSNAFLGYASGTQNSTGNRNAFVGAEAGSSNSTGSSNSAFGYKSDFLGNNLTNATAIGALSRVDTSNSMVLGSISGINTATADTNVGIGTTAPTTRLHVVGSPADTLIYGNNLAGGNGVRGYSATGIGVVGQGTGSFGTGVFGNGKTGVEGASFAAGDSTASIAVYGRAESLVGATYGVWGQTKSDGGRGVRGWALSQTGSTIGVEGRNDSSSGSGVSGFASSSTGNTCGVCGTSASNTGRGIGGFSSAGYGVYGGTDTGFAGYFDGKAYFSGNVGLGTTAPAAQLHVVGNSLLNGVVTVGSTVPAARLDIVTGPDGQSGPVDAIRISGPNSPADANSAQDIRWSFRSAGSAAIRAYRGNGWDTFMQFSTNTFGQGNDSPQVRMHIDQSGRIGIATTTPDSTLTVNGSASKPGGGSWATFSDERLKNITGRFTEGLKAVMKLDPVVYRYKPNNPVGIESSEYHVGFSAQAVQQIIPEAVSKNENGFLLVNNDPIMWTMLNAVKEQQGQIESQQKQIASQQAEISALKALVCKRNKKAAVCKAH